MKHEVFNKVRNYAIAAEKMSMVNIVFPQWNEMDVIKDIFRQMVTTKEAPAGHLYDEEEYRVVLRIYDGRLKSSDMMDVYCWSRADFLKKAKNIKTIGCNSGNGLLNLAALLEEMSDEAEKLQVANFFSSLNKDLLYVESAAEQRKVVEVTQELYDSGIARCIDSWVEPDENGNYEFTELNVGDFLVLEEDKECVYCIRREAFLATHKFI